MTWSLALMSIATVFWCQAMGEKHLWVYSVSVLVTAIGKTLWRIYVSGNH